VIFWLAACLDDEVGDAETASEYIAFQSDFERYQEWPSAKVADDPVGSTHLTGPRYVYIDEPPPPGSLEFPIGTHIVKEAQNGDEAEWDVFAMVKRGGGYNPAGARNWEWFELDLSGGTPVILWRGENPPIFSGYECVNADGSLDEDGDCSGCHSSSWENDYVHDWALQLEDVTVGKEP
jgi:hypothetical protein